MPLTRISGLRTFAFALMTATFALALGASSPARADVSSDVTFYDALYDLAYRAKESNRLVQRDNLESRPFRTPALRIMARVRETKANVILWGFGNEITSAVAKVISLGGATRTAEIIGLIKDAANSDSVADFLLKAGPKKAWKTLKDKFKARGEIDKNAERLADAAMNELFKKIQLAKSKKRVVSSKTTGGRKGGSEELTIDLDVVKGEAVISLRAQGCTCNSKTDLRAYSGQVVGTFSPRFLAKEDKLNWRFAYRTSSFSGSPCNPRDDAVAKRWEQIFAGNSTAKLPGADEPSVCTAATCTFLVQRLDLEEQAIQGQACRVGRLRREDRTDSDEYTYVDETWNGLSASLNGAFGEYVRCQCDAVAGVSPDVFKLPFFRDVLKRSIRPPYVPPPIPVDDKVYCPQCDPGRSWIGTWNMWGTVEIGTLNDALKFDWHTTFGPANPIETAITFVDKTRMKVEYEMASGIQTGSLDLKLLPGGRTFEGTRTREGTELRAVGKRVGEPQFCAR